jgi:hypothetical protein
VRPAVGSETGAAGTIARFARRSAVVAVLATGGVLVTTESARADDALARQHFKKGIELYDRKRFAEALEAFQEAYREKPSATIKQNIALSLKGLDRPAEAAAAFDEALEEGRTTLKPETARAIERELAELSKVVATMNFTVVGEDRRPVEGAVIVVTLEGDRPRELAPGAHHRPIRLMPGLYTFSARALGHAEPPPKRLAIVSGAPVDATFVVTPLAPAAPAGSAGPAEPNGKVPDAPPEYVAPAKKPPKRARWYAVPAVAFDTVSYRLGVPLDEPAPYGSRRSNFVGASIGGRLGYAAARAFSIEALADVGELTAKYRLRGSDPSDTETSVLHWQITPMLRFTGPAGRKVRFTLGTGAGVRGTNVTTKLPSRAGVVGPREGDGVGLSWLVDAGIQVDVAPIFLEAAGFVDVHDVTSVRQDRAPEDRLLYASPATRAGLRLGIGIPF